MDTRSKYSDTGVEHRVAVLIQENVVAVDLAVPMQVFGRWPTPLLAAVNRHASPYHLDIVGRGPTSVEGWLRVDDPAPISALADAHTVVVPGVMEPSEAPDPLMVAAVRDAHEAGARIVSICTGAFLLAEAGILDGRRATTHWLWADLLRQRYPRIGVVERELYVDSGNVITSAGVLAGADLCMHVVRSDWGQHVANSLSRFLVSPPHRDGGQAQYTTLSGPPPTELDRVSRWIVAHLDEQITVDQIAAHAHMSARTLARHFRNSLGMSVMDWVARQRVARARELLETTDRTITDIATACGFGSHESLRLHFAEHTMTSPSRYRKTFR